MLSCQEIKIKSEDSFLRSTVGKSPVECITKIKGDII